MRTSAIAACCALLLLAACGGGKAASTASKQPSDAVAHVGQPAPDWTEPLAPPFDPPSRTTLSLSSLRGKVVYLNFFATWCPPCNEEAPWINALQKEFAARGLQVVGVDVLESAAKAQQFRAKHHLVYPAIADDGTLRAQYNINGLPVHAFIDRNGVLRNLIVGEVTPEEMELTVEGLLR